MNTSNAVASSSTAGSAAFSKTRNRMPGTKIMHPPSTTMLQLQDLKPEKYDEHWVVFYQQSDCFWYNSLWWFPEPGRNADTMPMFVAARWSAVDNIKVGASRRSVFDDR
ncbi:hypothetical protein IAT38_002344 [Cryptococcus sp. DSM 104549]